MADNPFLLSDRPSMTTSNSRTSLSLLVRLRDAGDADAWARLDQLYTGLLRAWFARAGLQPFDRDDLTQNAMAVIIRRLPSFEHDGRPGAFRSWLRSIATNLLREHWRRQKSAESDSILAELADPASPLSRVWDEEHERHVLQGSMEQARSEFTEPTWQAFCGVAMDGRPARSVADELGMSVNAVLIAKSRVLARVREIAAGLID
jgi:RNA polymerase sigma-70 factor (ECF subfamily)